MLVYVYGRFVENGFNFLNILLLVRNESNIWKEYWNDEMLQQTISIVFFYHILNAILILVCHSFLINCHWINHHTKKNSDGIFVFLSEEKPMEEVPYARASQATTAI